ncbi:MAG: hypothetical protein ACI30B_07540 [Paludibacteraceae bacterium]
MRYKSLILIFFICLASCKTLKPLQEVDKSNHADTVRIVERDSIYFSVLDTFRIYTKGDTVFSDVIRWRIEYKEIFRSDTVIGYDSIYLDKVVTVREMSKLQRAFFWLGVVAVLLAVVYVGIRIVKIVRK